MTDHDASDPFLRDSPTQQLSRIAAGFARIVSCLTQPASPDEVTAVLAETQTLCERAADVPHEAEVRNLLPNLKTAVMTWRQVWPRLGEQREFRQAVLREAGLWARRLDAMARRS